MSKRVLETVGDLRMALEGIEDSADVLCCMQPREIKDRTAANSKVGRFSEVRLFEEGLMVYMEILEKGNEDA